MSYLNEEFNVQVFHKGLERVMTLALDDDEEDTGRKASANQRPLFTEEEQELIESYQMMKSEMAHST